MVPICLRCLKCTKFGQLVLAKIIKIVATRCQILRLKCTKFDIGWGSAPDPAGGAYRALPDPLAGFKGLLLRTGERGEWRGREGRGKREGEGREGRGRERREGSGGDGTGRDRSGHPQIFTWIIAYAVHDAFCHR